MTPLSNAEFNARLTEAYGKEQAEPIKWFYLSFAKDRFLGAVVIEAHGIVDVLSRCLILDINPGGAVVAAVMMPQSEIEKVPEADRSRLLSEADLRRIFPGAKSLAERKAS